VILNKKDQVRDLISWRKLSFVLTQSRKRISGKGTISRLTQLTVFMAIVSSMLALNHELTAGSSRYLESLNVDYWIAQRGADSLASSSYVAPKLARQLEADGYKVDGTLVYFSKLGDRQIVYQSYKPGGILSPQLENGRQVAGPSETVLDHVLANQAGIKVGDTVRLGGRDFTVVGLSKRTNSIGKEIAFVNQQAMDRLVGSRTYNVLAVKLHSGQVWPPADISLKGYVSMSHGTFIKRNTAYWEQSITPFFTIIIAIAIAGSLGLMVLSFKRDVDARLKEIATLRCIGASISQVFAIEAATGLFLLLAALFASWPLAGLIVRAANSSVPGVTAHTSVIYVFLSLGAGLLVCLLALIAPFWRVKQLKPMELLRNA
jgi:ABC-type antimicrobial peptide transport system permease subunit